jgi:hypothetical protein
MEVWFSDMEISIKKRGVGWGSKRTEKNKFKKEKIFGSQ